MKDTIAFIVGLEHYQKQPTPISSVQFAEADAKAMKQALEGLGVPAANIELIISAQATKTSLESRLKSAICRLSAANRFIFFFAGHGLSISDQNYLTCHDTQRGDLAATSIPLGWVFETVRRTKCQQTCFFLDCCHSGLPLAASMRGIADHMTDTEFAAFFGGSEYQVAFAACKPDESSHSAVTLSHGIWTYHVLQALRGEDISILDKGRFLTAWSLQNHLAVEVPRTLRTTVSLPARQTPCVFGNATADFIIADLKPLLDARQASLASQPKAPRNALFAGERLGTIKKLSGFKRHHTVPESANPATQRFVASISEQELKQHADRVLDALRNQLGYGIKDVSRAFTEGSASLKAKDFDVNIDVTVRDDQPSFYSIRTEVTNFRNPAIVAVPEFNQAVGPFVERMELQLPSKFDIEGIIDRLEKGALKDSVEIDYTADLNDVEIRFLQSGVSLRFKKGICEVATETRSSPLTLLEAVAGIQSALVASGTATVPLLKP